MRVTMFGDLQATAPVEQSAHFRCGIVRDLSSAPPAVQERITEMTEFVTAEVTADGAAHRRAS